MKENIWYERILCPTQKGAIACSAGDSEANFQDKLMLDALLDAPRRGAANALCVTRGGYGRLFGRRQHGNFQKRHYNCSAAKAGSKHQQQLAQTHSAAWVSIWPQFYVTLGGYGRLIGRRQHGNPQKLGQAFEAEMCHFGRPGAGNLMFLLGTGRNGPFGAKSWPEACWS